ncbi:MAG: murein transglycosylase [Planctomycetes bacterium]|nr:murein transglycosylase [Planctomycetota bacterium]
MLHAHRADHHHCLAADSRLPHRAGGCDPGVFQAAAAGAPALRLVTDPAVFRAVLASAYDSKDATLNLAVRRSLSWFEAPSAQTHFPIEGVTFDRAKASVTRFADILTEATWKDQFIADTMSSFSLYESVGWDGSGTVLFTGYYAPEFRASATRSGSFQYPLYKLPPDLVKDPATGLPLGRRVNGTLQPWPARREIDQSGMLAGTELVWLSSPLDAYIIHVNGSAKLLMPDGSTLYVGYAGKTDRPYTGLGSTMVKRGLISPDRLSLPSLRAYFKQHPEQAEPLIYENENYVFFQEYAPGTWPAGSLGVTVTEKRSLATDKAIFPRGGIVIADTHIPTYSGGRRPFVQFMVDQDTGGAIKAPGRADIFMGVGAVAELVAGRQYTEGRLYYLFLNQ